MLVETATSGLRVWYSVVGGVPLFHLGSSKEDTLLSGMCPVLSLKIVDCSPLLSLLIGSFGFGVLMRAFKACPVEFLV